MTFNATTLTYRILLLAEVPIYNPNYVKAEITGNVSVSFFDAEAGWTQVGPVLVAPRSSPWLLKVKVDASNLPRKYTQVVYTHCFNFPRKLIFFLLGTFQVKYLGYVSQLPSVDTYFMLDCSKAKGSSNSHEMLPGLVQGGAQNIVMPEQQTSARQDYADWTNRFVVNTGQLHDDDALEQV
eukprot:jgi/Chrzof1/1678/Cz10g16260.t1